MCIRDRSRSSCDFPRSHQRPVSAKSAGRGIVRMRMTRLFVAGVFTAALFPLTVSAQRTRDFEDSWFWGVKGGAATYSAVYGDGDAAATYGAEWLITRTHGALYVSFDQANIKAT